jgi:putative SOS response-associated peptidase YedK
MWSTHSRRIEPISRSTKPTRHHARMRFSVHTGPRGAQRCDDRERVMMRWGMPPPAAHGRPASPGIRNTSLPQWRAWRTSSNRKLLASNRF